MPEQQQQLQRLEAALADRYHIEGELDQGGMATVYLAENLKHDRKVAIKVLNPELAAVLGAERTSTCWRRNRCKSRTWLVHAEPGQPAPPSWGMPFSE